MFGDAVMVISAASFVKRLRGNMANSLASTIEYTCPNCHEHYVLWDSSKPPISAQRANDLSEIVRKQYDLGYCKKCHRKDPSIPTTFEMDGLLTPDDIEDRNKVMLQCRDCSKWTVQDTEKLAKGDLSVCANCQGKDFDTSSLISKRSWNPLVKRKVKKKK